MLDYCCIIFVSLIIIHDGIKRYKYLNGTYVLLRKAASKVKVKYSIKTSTTQTLEGQENVDLSLLLNTMNKQGSS